MFRYHKETSYPHTRFSLLLPIIFLICILSFVFALEESRGKQQFKQYFVKKDRKGNSEFNSFGQYFDSKAKKKKKEKWMVSGKRGIGRSSTKQSQLSLRQLNSYFGSCFCDAGGDELNSTAVRRSSSRSRRRVRMLRRSQPLRLDVPRLLPDTRIV